jgi:hypothetical protein
VPTISRFGFAAGDFAGDLPVMLKQPGTRCQPFAKSVCAHNGLGVSKQNKKRAPDSKPQPFSDTLE